MNCKKVLRLLSAFQDRELTQALEREIELHLRACGACRKERDELQEVVGRLRLLPPPACDPYFPAKVMSGLPIHKTGKFRLLPAAAYALAFVTIFLGGFILQLSSDSTAGPAKPHAATFTAVLLENQDLGLLAVHDNTLVLFER